MGQLVQPVAVKVSQRSLSTGDISVVVTEPEVRNTSSDSDLSSQSATSQLDLNSSESATDSDTGSSSSSISVGYAMANRPQIKFLSPPIFKGLPDEDALDWLDRYEKTGAYNRWGNPELRENFNMYLDGAARKVFLLDRTSRLGGSSDSRRSSRSQQ